MEQKIELNRMIDHTLLKPEATENDIQTLCREAAEYQFKSVCINPCWVKTSARILEGTETVVCTVIGFPLGANKTEIKVFETTQAIKDGAKEVDMVLNIGALKSGLDNVVSHDISEVVQAAKGKALVKVIIETCLLTKEEKIHACELAKAAGADFVKTSTGFSTGGATIEDIKLMRSTVGPEMGVKASGGVKIPEQAAEFVKAGATRIGTSNGVALLGKEAADPFSY